jgi:hypothetical protein
MLARGLVLTEGTGRQFCLTVEVCTVLTVDGVIRTDLVITRSTTDEILRADYFVPDFALVTVPLTDIVVTDRAHDQLRGDVVPDAEVAEARVIGTDRGTFANRLMNVVLADATITDDTIRSVLDTHLVSATDAGTPVLRARPGAVYGTGH